MSKRKWILSIDGVTKTPQRVEFSTRSMPAAKGQRGNDESEGGLSSGRHPGH